MKESESGKRDDIDLSGQRNSCVLRAIAAFQFALLAACVALPILARAHGGGLDAYGCHHNRKAGGYHCHRGPLAGQDFASKDEMLVPATSALSR